MHSMHANCSRKLVGLVGSFSMHLLLYSSIGFLGSANKLMDYYLPGCILLLQ